MYSVLAFSPTGNAAHIAKEIALLLDDDIEVLALEHTNPMKLRKEEHLVLVYAIHAFNAPKTVKRFINKLPPSLYKSISLIGVGCNTGWVNGAVSGDIRRMFTKKGYEICVDEVIAMPLTFIMSFPDDVIKEQLITARNMIIRISKEIKESYVTNREIPIKSKIVSVLGRAEPFASKLFGLELHAKKTCIQCGLCAKECPEKNIRMTSAGKIAFGFNCTMCMRCIYHCPQNAITPRISKFIPISKGYSLNKYLDED